MKGYPEWSEGGGGGRGHHNIPMPPMPPPPMPPGHMQHPKKTSWLLPDYNGGGGPRGGGGAPPLPMPPPLGMPPGYGGGGGHHHGGFGGGHGFPPGPPRMRMPPGGGGGRGGGRGAASEVSFDTSGKDPASVRARIFIGSLNGQHEVVSREDVIELCLPYGSLRGVTFFKKQGYAFVQFEDAGDADACCRELNGVRWKGCVMDVHPVDAPTRGPGAAAAGAPRPLMPPPSVKAVPTTTYDEISYDTSSKDPGLLRARVFIGSLNRAPVMRNHIIELCLPFGRVTAVTLFKGYAFVQFENAVDAVEACEKLNGKLLRGNTIDVHLAMEGGANRKRVTDDVAPTAKSPDTAMDWTGSSAPKRAREAEMDNSFIQTPKHGVDIICSVCRGCWHDAASFVAHREGGACVQLTRTGEPPSLGCASCDAVLPNAWRLAFHLMDDHHHKMKLVTVDGSPDALAKAREADESKKDEWWASVERWLEGVPKGEEEGEGEEKKEGEEEKEEVKEEGIEISDVTIVCGACKLVTGEWAAYVEHKKRDCIKPRDELEPAVLVCAMCAAPFVSAWKAIFHLMDFHRMKLFYPDYSEEALAKSFEQQAREAPSVEKRMKAWIEKHSAAPAPATS